MVTHRMIVGNMETEDDKQKIDDVLHDVWGIKQAKVDLKTGEVLLSYDEKAASLIDFEQAIVDSGFKVLNEQTSVQQDAQKGGV